MPCTLSPPLAFFFFKQSSHLLSRQSLSLSFYTASCHFSLANIKKRTLVAADKTGITARASGALISPQLWWLGITSVPGWHKRMQSTNERSSVTLQWSRLVLMLVSNVNRYAPFFFFLHCRRVKNDARFDKLNTVVRFLWAQVEQKALRPSVGDVCMHERDGVISRTWLFQDWVEIQLGTQTEA